MKSRLPCETQWWIVLNALHLVGVTTLYIGPKYVNIGGFGKKNAIKFLVQGDQHCDDPGHVDGAFKLFLKAVKESPEGSGCMLLGDTFTFANTRSQKALKKAMQEATEDVESEMDAWRAYQTAKVCKSLELYGQRIWGIVKGNHGWVFSDGSTVESRMAEHFKSKYSDGLFVLALRIKPKGDNGSAVQCNIVAHHGVTGAQTRGGDINNILKHTGYFGNAHIVVEGHTHDLYAVPAKPILSIGNGTIPVLKAIMPWVARCGSAKAHFRPGSASYEERRMFAPSLPGHVEFDIWVERDVGERVYTGGKMKGGDRTVIHVLGRAVPYQGKDTMGPGANA